MTITPSSYLRCNLFAECVHSQPRDNDDYVLNLISRMRVTTDDFIFLDEAPGEVWVKDQSYRTTKWHRRLRKVRDNKGNDLFKRLKENDLGESKGASA